MSSTVEMATPTLPTSPRASGMVRVVAHLGRQVEGDREAGLPLLEEVAEALVGLGRRAEAGVLAHRPEPPAVHRGLDAARERDTRPGSPRSRDVVEPPRSAGVVQALDRRAPRSREAARALGRRAERGLERPLAPTLCWALLERACPSPAVDRGRWLTAECSRASSAGCCRAWCAGSRAPAMSRAPRVARLDHLVDVAELRRHVRVGELLAVLARPSRP